MRLRLLLALLFVTSAQTFCQQPAVNPPAPAAPKDPRAFFESSVRHYDFSDATLEPWHLKATYQLYDFEGKPTVHGTWEYWWVSPKVRRKSWKRQGMSRTDWITKDGTIYSKASGESLHYYERNLEDILLNPEPVYEAIESGKLTLGLKTVGMEPDSSICLTTLRKPEANDKQKMPIELETPDLYCFDTGTMALIGSYSNPTLILYKQIVKMQDHYIPQEIAVQIYKQTVLSVSVESIDHIAANDPSLDHPADAVPIRRSLLNHFDVSAMPENIIPGKQIKKSPPHHPPMPKSLHIRGIVVLAITIGTDGKPHDMEVLGAPSKPLADSAVNSARLWKYTPFLLNGEPVEVEGITKVIFTMGS